MLGADAFGGQRPLSRNPCRFHRLLRLDLCFLNGANLRNLQRAGALIGGDALDASTLLIPIVGVICPRPAEGGAIGALAVTIAAAVAGVGPRNIRLKAALAAAGDGAAAAPAELTALARDPVLHGAMRLQLVALVEIVYLMVRKPSGVGILVSLLVAAAAVIAVVFAPLAVWRYRRAVQ